MYIAATNDNLVPAAAIEHLKTHLPQLKVVTLEGKHFILQCQPNACFEAVMTFLDDLMSNFD